MALTAFMVILCLALFSTPVSAHKVIAEIYPTQSGTEGELGFSNGDMASGVPVTVTDAQGVEIGLEITDSDGFFTWNAGTGVVRLPLRFDADLGAGHVAEMILTQADLPAGHSLNLRDNEGGRDAVGVAAPVSPEVSRGGVDVAALTHSAPAEAEITTAELPAAVATALRAELRPIRRELILLRERNRLGNILGGIGIICGVFGLFFYLAARRKLRQDHP